MFRKKILLLVIFLFIIKFTSATTFEGYTYNMSGSAMSGVNVTIEIWAADPNDYMLKQYSNFSNESGYWTVNISESELTIS